MNDEEPFNTFLWHDNAIHGFRIEEGENGTGELILDIDLIVEWLPPQDASHAYRFRLAPADLRFHEVADLAVALDYTVPRFGLTPPTIHQAVRELRSYSNGFTTYAWALELLIPHGGVIRFESSGFTQLLRAEPVISEAQWLSPMLRSR